MSKPNQTQNMEYGKKFAILVFFTKEELKQLEYHCNKEKMSMGRWLAELAKDELQLDLTYETEEKIMTSVSNAKKGKVGASFKKGDFSDLLDEDSE